MIRLGKYLRNYKKEAVIGPLFKLLEACFELLIPLVMAGIVDRGIRARDTRYIWEMGLVMAGLGALGLACSLTAQYFAAKAAAGFGTELREDLYAHINRFSYADLDAMGTATLVTRLTNDVNLAQAGVNLVLRLFLRSPFLVVGAVAMAFSINVRLAWIFVGLVPLLSAILYWVMARGIPLYRKVQNRLDQVVLATRENLEGARVVRAFSRQKEACAEFAGQNDALLQGQLAAGRVSALLNPATSAVVNAAIALVLWQGAKKVDGGILTQGELTALTNYLAQILLALVALANLIVSVTRASAAAARINEVFAVQPAMQEACVQDAVTDAGGQECSPQGVAGKGMGGHARAQKGASVSFDHVCFAYPGQKDVLEDITFAACPGETVGVIGGTGAGKTSLVNLIPRFYDARSGVVRVDGKDVRAYAFADLRGRVGVVPQSPVLFSGTVRDNLLWGQDATDAQLICALQTAQAWDFLEEKEGLATAVSQGGKNFSGGQRQRLAIARALVREPQILLLDDSASALDYATEARLRKALFAQAAGMTVFCVSQRVASIRRADRIVVLDEGRVAGIGTHAELSRNCRVYQEICQAQQVGTERGAG